MTQITEKNPTNRFIAAAIFFMLFLQTIVMVKFFDVDTIGPMGTSIGCSHINQAFHDLTGVSSFLYDLTTYLGILAILAVAVFAFMGLTQLIKRRSLIKVDMEILLMGGLYLFIFILYVFFEKVIVNYRPILMEGETFPEPSFPSSHAVLIVVVMFSVMMVAGRYIGRGGLNTLVQILCAAVMAVTFIGRLLCGAHWLTDIIGGAFISAALMFLFSGLMVKYTDNQQTGKRTLMEK